MFREHEKILKFIAYIDKEAFGFINNFMNAINDLTKQLCHPQETNTTFIQNCYTNYKKFISNVDKFRNKFTTRKCLAPKFYYPKHAIEFAEMHGVTPGFMDEQSIESELPRASPSSRGTSRFRYRSGHAILRSAVWRRALESEALIREI